MELSHVLEKLSDQIAELRNHIGWPGLYETHFEPDKDRWNKFCAALDTLEDTNLAISAYTSRGLGSTDEERYLHFYGLLQAVFVQQDAIIAIWKTVNNNSFPELDSNSGWKTIRNIRNHSAGHPVNRRTFVTRMNLEFGHVSLLTERSGYVEQWGGALDCLLANYLKEACTTLTRIFDHVVRNWPRPI